METIPKIHSRDPRKLNYKSIKQTFQIALDFYLLMNKYSSSNCLAIISRMFSISVRIIWPQYKVKWINIKKLSNYELGKGVIMNYIGFLGIIDRFHDKGLCDEWMLIKANWKLLSNIHFRGFLTREIENTLLFIIC